MRLSNYLILCLLLSVVIVVSILFIPSVGQTIEGAVLGFLSSNAS